MHERAVGAAAKRRARGARRPFALLLAGAAASTLAGCDVPLVTTPGVVHQPTSCVIADVSGSTLPARGAYIDDFRELAQQLAHENGRMCLVLASGNPLAETLPHMADLTPEHPNNGLLAPGEIETKVDALTSQFRYVLRHPGTETPGSALVEAAALAGKVVRSGGRLEFYSDAVQLSPLLDVHKADLSDAGIQTILDDLAARGLLPNLDGVTVAFPLPFYHPDVRPNGQSAANAYLQERIKAFWSAWAARAGANLPVAWGTR